jgi:hypothetical protein
MIRYGELEKNGEKTFVVHFNILVLMWNGKNREKFQHSLTQDNGDSKWRPL